MVDIIGFFFWFPVRTSLCRIVDMMLAKSFTVATFICSRSSRLLPVHLMKVLQTSECESREMKSSLQVSFWSTGLSEEMMLPMMSGPGFLSF